MKNKSILFKSITCGVMYLFFYIALIWAIYIFDAFELSFVLGTVYAVVIAVIAYCDAPKRMILTVGAGILSAGVLHVILELLSVPYRIVLFIYRNDEFVKDAGRVTVNESIGLVFGSISFWSALLMSSFILAIVSSCIISYRKSQQ